ncbi:LysR family transcriptional regulator [Paenibacillus contaminans]|uniref:LysR family transcriptional regulator n=1 Tax=Paenibacillus contaminans TaxID=450362 RepID=A0A329MKS0_9BACL|nr:LysR family transcriptional regulator [Paenibacillus contaminans]RAV18467.1 LysR family transcriptional regulator [Paenibacillus contaminans]
MEIRQLLYAVQIAADKNFSRAAEKLHIAQPSLSQQLAKLEKEIGVLLFQRNTNSVEATHAGTVFVEKAQTILDMIAQLKKEMEDISQMRKGKLIVGSLPMTGAHILPRVLPVFYKLHPGIEVMLVEETTSNLEALTASGQTDISLLTLPVIDPALSYAPLIEEEIELAVPPQHPLAALGQNGEAVDIGKLRDEPFIVLKRGQGFRQLAFELCETAGFVPRVVFESSNIETVQSLVAAGMGISFVPSMIARELGSPFVPVYVKLNGAPSRMLVIAYRKGRYLSKAAEAFIETAVEAVKQHPQG